jgi:hypothetical protein
MKRILGEVAFAKEDYDTARQRYAEGLPLIMLHGGWGKYVIDKELDALRDKLSKLPRSEARTWIDYLSEEWEKCQPEDVSGYLKSWCNLQLSAVSLWDEQ